MLVDKFKEIAKSNGWVFNYGKEEWQNLLDLRNDPNGKDRQIYLLFLYRKRKTKRNEHNAITSVSYSGELILAMRSELNDKDANFKYENVIRKLEQDLDGVGNLLTSCEGWGALEVLDTEVFNELDTNVDGLRAEFSVNYEY